MAARGRHATGGRRARKGPPEVPASLDELRLLAETARRRLLATPWGLRAPVDAAGRDLLMESARSGAIKVPLANTAEAPRREEDLPSSEVALALATFYAAGLLAARGESVPAIMAPLVADTLRQLRRLRPTEAAR